MLNFVLSFFHETLQNKSLCVNIIIAKFRAFQKNEIFQSNCHEKLNFLGMISDEHSGHPVSEGIFSDFLDTLLEEDILMKDV